MALVTKNDVTQIFAIQAPSIDLPPTFANYPRGWDTARSNNGKPTIKQFNYIQQRTDQNLLWIHQNGAALPYDAAMEYAENAHVVKDGELQKKQGASWIPAANKGYNLDYFVGGKSYPLHAEIMLENGDIVKSTIADNTANPNVDMMGWVLDSNTVENIGELLLIQSPKNNKTVFVKSRNGNTLKGGGYFNFVVGSTENDGGQFFATATGSWHRITMETWKNVQWWGALGDGVTDDLPALNKAVKSLKGSPDALRSNGSFCTLYFPATSGAYVITDTLYTYPWIRFKGDSSRGGSTAHNNANYSKIGAKFPDAINYKWAVSTTNVVVETGLMLPWDGTCTGEQIDAGIISPCFGSCIEDLWIDNLTPANRIYGGIRFIAAPQSSIERCWIENFDVCVLFTGSWDIRVDVGTVSHKCGVAVWGSSNGVKLDGYQHAKPSVSPLPVQMPMFEVPQAVTCGVYAQWAPSITSSVLICEYFTLGVFINVGCTVNIASYYAEANRCSIKIIASGVAVGNITGVGNTYTCELGEGASFSLDSMSDTNYTTSFFELIHSFALSANIPETIKVANSANPKVHFKNRDKSVVYVSSTTGNDAWSGLLSHQPVKTLAQALFIVGSRTTSNQWSDIQNNNRVNATVIILDSAEYHPQGYQPIENMNVQFIAESGVTPTIVTSNEAFKLFNSNVQVTGVKLRRTYDNNYQLSQGMFICSGDCSIDVESTNVDLAYHFVSVDPADKAKVSLNILGGTGTMTSTAKYFETASPNVYVNSFIRLNNTGFNLNTTADNGITAPVEAWIQKSVTAVV